MCSMVNVYYSLPARRFLHLTEWFFAHRSTQSNLSDWCNQKLEQNTTLNVYCDYETKLCESVVEQKDKMPEGLCIPYCNTVSDKPIRLYNRCGVHTVKFIYNRFAVVIYPEGDFSKAVVPQVEKVECGTNDHKTHETEFGTLQNSVEYELTFDITHEKAKVKFYLVHDKPRVVESADGPLYRWPLVLRAQCRVYQNATQRTDPCTGPILYPQESHFPNPSYSCTEGRSPSPAENDAMCMHLAIDEFCSHVNAEYFRLLVVVMEDTTNLVLGTSVSKRITVQTRPLPIPPIAIPLYVEVPRGCHLLEVPPPENIPKWLVVALCMVSSGPVF